MSYNRSYAGYEERRGGGGDSYDRRGERSYDHGRGWTERKPREITPKNSKLFCLSKGFTDESVVREMFESFGTIEDIYVKKHRDTGRTTGVAFVKYEKASEAAEAKEAMEGKTVGEDHEQLTIAVAKNEGDKSEGDKAPTRIFIMVPRTFDKPEIQEAFEEYGQIEHISIVKDKNSGESKGLAYVNFYSFKDAAHALEKCAEKYRPQWAESREKMMEKRKYSDRGDDRDYYMGRGGERGGGSRGYADPAASMLPMMSAINPNGCCRLKVQFSPQMNKDIFYSLFNIVPGLVSCDLAGVDQDGAISRVVYNNPQSAAHAMERICGFEYPPGYPINMIYDGMPQQSVGGGGMRPDVPDNIRALMENIKAATDAIQSAGFGDLAGAGGGARGGHMSRSVLLGDGVKDAQAVCSAKLPERMPVLPINTKSAKRLFWVLKDAREQPNPEVMSDAFCRFGNLIEVFCIRNKKCGYARYATEEAAERAIEVLDGEDLLGSRIRVEFAEDLGSGDHKRPRRE